METCGPSMPHLHFHFYSFIKRMWNLLAEGATKFNNIKVVTKSRLIDNLNSTYHLWALQVLKALLDQISLHQSQGTPIIVQAVVITRYCPLATPHQGPTQFSLSIPRHHTRP